MPHTKNFIDTKYLNKRPIITKAHRKYWVAP